MAIPRTRHARHIVDAASPSNGDAAAAAAARKSLGAGGRRASFQRSQSFRINAITAGVSGAGTSGSHF